MKTDKRGKELLEDIASYFDMLAADSEMMATKWKTQRRENKERAKVWREAASDVRSIELI